MDLLKALEPKYRSMIEGRGPQRFGFTKQFMNSMLQEYHLFADPLENICRKAGEKYVKEFMYTPSEGKYVTENASLGEALHQLIMGHHQSLLVTRSEKIMGVLRLTDVFVAVMHKMKECCG
jgi:hypothetical protein